MIEINHFNFAYDKENVLTDVSAHFPLGDFCALVGPNGAGKSTLLKAIAKLITGSGGVLVDGKSVDTYSALELARKVAYVSQYQDIVFDFSVYDTVLMGRNPYQNRWTMASPKDVEIVTRALEKTHLIALKDRMLTQLSGGELQRAFIARAIAQQTPYLLLDEPFSNLDIAHQLEILEILTELNQQYNTTILLIVHDFSVALQWAKSALLLDEGRVIVQGTPKEVLTKERLINTFRIPHQHTDWFENRYLQIKK
ncbi:MAG: ABC transporter ATP-binding protein [Bacteroidales bacterium]|nr:ABC transporter ATP-binding protein [Bacteroidales bacterium]